VFSLDDADTAAGMSRGGVCEPACREDGYTRDVGREAVGGRLDKGRMNEEAPSARRRRLAIFLGGLLALDRADTGDKRAPVPVRI